MADLFDMKVGGLGFHLTAHMIALVALFVACFAITGYITFRDGSISEKKLDGANFLTAGEAHDAVVTSLAYPGGSEKWYSLTVPALAAAVVTDGDSIGLIQDGFGVGMAVVATNIFCSKATVLATGACALSIGTTIECALSGTGGTDIAGGAVTVGNPALNEHDTGCTIGDATTKFTATDTAVCVDAAGAAAGFDGTMVVSVLVRAAPGVTLP